MYYTSRYHIGTIRSIRPYSTVPMSGIVVLADFRSTDFEHIICIIRKYNRYIIHVQCSYIIYLGPRYITSIIEYNNINIIIYIIIHKNIHIHINIH